ncbi:putative uncharacterized protein PY07799 [Acidiphilium sp. CAG:727]|nr:putative uncharacterized protein PY07799 [Acidiphilium sp. CAG:727]
MSEGYRKRHILFGFVGRVTEHHTLIARAESVGFVAAFAVFYGIVDAHRYIRALLVYGSKHGARVAVETVFGSVVADSANRVSRDGLNIHVAISCDFAHNEYQTRGSGSFAGNPCIGVFR